MLRVDGDVIDGDFSDVPWKRFLDVRYAVVDVLRGALGDHLDASVSAIADEPGKLMTAGHPVGGKTKTDTLNVTREYDVFCDHFLPKGSASTGNGCSRSHTGTMLIDAPGAR